MLQNLRRALVLAATATTACALVASPAFAGTEKPILKAFPNGPGTITLYWHHSGAGVRQFIVERPGTEWQSWGMPAESRVQVISALTAGAVYQFRVCAVYDFNRVCSENRGGYLAVRASGYQDEKTMPEQMRSQEFSGLPRARPVIVATLETAPNKGFIRFRKDSGLVPSRTVSLKWIDAPPNLNGTKVEWFRDGALIGQGSVTFKDVRQGNAKTSYRMCLSTARAKMCSNEAFVVPVEPLPAGKLTNKPSAGASAIRAL